MAVRLGSARIDENGNIRSGRAGDQTKREVMVENWYTHSKGWVTLRAKESVVAEKIARAMERACDNDNIGYDQYQRNTLYNVVKNKGFDPALATVCETDCSALVRVCLAYAGIKVGDFNTATERKVILATGKFLELPTSEATARRGDILVTRTQGHTVVVLTDGIKASVKYYPDISHHHPVTNWSTVKATCPFIISKATQGTDFIDPTLNSFIKNCEKYGIPYWLYAFLNNGDAKDEAPEKEQAEYMVKVCKGKVGKFFVGYVLDVERNNSAESVKAAMDYLAKQSSKIMVYTGYRHYNKYKGILASRPSNIGWWEARYNKKGTCHPEVDLHQYTESGSIAGIEPPIDLNYLTGSKSLDWFTSGKGEQTPTTKPVFTYAVRAGGKRHPETKNTPGYSGTKGKAITDVAIKVNVGSVKYRVHVEGGRWLPYVTGYDWSDYNNGYAGNGKPIDAIEIIWSDGRVKYRVSPVGKEYFDWQYGNETTGGQDGYAGLFGKTIDRLQITAV